MHLVEAAQRGGPHAIEDLIEAAWPDAFRIALSVCGDRALAEDAAQEACAILFCTIRRLRSSAAFKVWFFRIVMRESLRLSRKRGIEIAPYPSESPDIAEQIARLDVQAALSHLPSMQRAAVVLHFYADLNSRQIAQVLHIPDSSVRFHIMRAKRALRTSLKMELGNAV